MSKRWTQDELDMLFKVYQGWPISRYTKRPSAGWAQRGSQLLANRTVDACYKRADYLRRRVVAINTFKAEYEMPAPPVQAELPTSNVAPVTRNATKEEVESLRSRVHIHERALLEICVATDNFAQHAERLRPIAKVLLNRLREGAPTK